VVPLVALYPDIPLDQPVAQHLDLHPDPPAAQLWDLLLDPQVVHLRVSPPDQPVAQCRDLLLDPLAALLRDLPVVLLWDLLQNLLVAQPLDLHVPTHKRPNFGTYFGIH
jgi:hypothetical protein